jgi:hypothetical protein
MVISLIIYKNSEKQTHETIYCHDINHNVFQIPEIKSIRQDVIKGA